MGALAIIQLIATGLNAVMPIVTPLLEELDPKSTTGQAISTALAELVSGIAVHAANAQTALAKTPTP
jgi:hypothetical protein